MIAPAHRQEPIEDEDQLRRGLAVELTTLAEIVSDADPDLARDYRGLANSIRRRVIVSGIVDQLDRLESRLELCLADQER